MKQYGAKFATDISKKQVNVIFAKAKAGELKIEKWFIQELYDMADYYGYDDNRSVAYWEAKVKAIITAVFDGELDRAQGLIDDAQSSMFASFSKKNQEKCDRSLVA